MPVALIVSGFFIDRLKQGGRLCHASACIALLCRPDLPQHPLATQSDVVPDDDVVQRNEKLSQEIPSPFSVLLHLKHPITHSLAPVFDPTFRLLMQILVQTDRPVVARAAAERTEVGGREGQRERYGADDRRARPVDMAADVRSTAIWDQGWCQGFKVTYGSPRQVVFG